MGLMVDGSYSALFRNKSFIVLWINQFCLQFSYSVINFSLILWVYQISQKNIAVSLLLLTLSAPSIIFGIFAGVVADRVNRTKIIRFTNIVLAVLFLCFYFANNTLWIIYLLAFLISAVSQFFLPAEAATIPTIVPKELLVKANSLFSLTIYASLILGYTLAGPLIGFSGNYETPFVFAGFLTLFASLYFLRFPFLNEHHKKQAAYDTVSESFTHALVQIKEGLGYIYSHKILLVAILLLTGVQVFVSVISAMIPDYIDKILQIPATNASYIIMLPLGLGLICGAFFNGAYGKYVSRRRLVEISILGVSICLLLIAFAPVISNYLAFRVLEISSRIRRPLEHVIGLTSLLSMFSFLLGFFNVSIVIPAQTVLQENTPEDLRGRVFGVLTMMMSSLAAFPVIAVGSLADMFGIVRCISTLGFVALFVSLFVMSKRFVTEHLLFRK
jgi:MFS family permease